MALEYEYEALDDKANGRAQPLATSTDFSHQKRATATKIYFLRMKKELDWTYGGRNRRLKSRTHY